MGRHAFRPASPISSQFRESLCPADLFRASFSPAPTCFHFEMENTGLLMPGRCLGEVWAPQANPITRFSAYTRDRYSVMPESMRTEFTRSFCERVGFAHIPDM